MAFSKSRKVKWDGLILSALILLVFGFVAILSFPFIKPYAGGWGIDQDKASDLGTFVGGYIGTFLLLFSVVLLLISLSVQRQAIQIQQFEAKFLDMLKLHRDNVSEMTLANKTQRAVFVVLRSEYQDVYKIVSKHYKHHDNRNELKAKIAYVIFYYGLGETATPMVKSLLCDVEEVLLDSILSEIEKYRKKNGYRKLVYLSKFKLDEYLPFNGHQSRLAHYYRHLYQTVKYIHSQEYLTMQERKHYAKIVRAQMSNHELAILFYNSISCLGANWSTGEVDFIKEYQLLKNIPLKGFTYQLNPEEYYDQDYEWHEVLKCTS